MSEIEIRKTLLSNTDPYPSQIFTVVEHTHRDSDKLNSRRTYGEVLNGLLLELSSRACFHLQGKIDHREDYVTESHGLMEK